MSSFKDRVMASAPSPATRTATVHGIEWQFREWSESDRAKYMLWLKPKGEYNERRSADANCKLIVETVIDVNEPAFVDGDIPWLRSRPGWWVAPVVEQCLKAAGLDNDDLEEAAVKKPTPCEPAGDGSCTSS